VYEEVELRLRTTISAHSITGYEINFRCVSDGTQYVQIGRWNGPVNDFSGLADVRYPAAPGLFDGDVVKATIIGNVITVYINGVQVAQATDNTYTNGSPGVGHWLNGPSGLIGDYGFTSFTATDGQSQPPSAPTNLRIIQ
jgi:hypothetical protein